MSDHQVIRRFFVLGVGPGDPELLTVKALRLLQRAHIVYHAGPSDDQGRALDVIRTHLRPEQVTRTVRFDSMSAVSSEGPAAYRRGVEQIAADCRCGADVAFVTEGDPTIYSTASTIWQLLGEIAPEIPLEIIPGVSSINAAAARLGWPLAQKDEALVVIPAAYHPARLRQLIADFPAVCLFKVPRVLPQLIDTLKTFGPEREAAYVENLGTPQEWITHDLASALGRDNYFALAIVRQAVDVGLSPRLQESARAGRLAVVGLGPGDIDHLTLRALRTLRAAEAIVGYEVFLRQLEPLGLSAELYRARGPKRSIRARHWNGPPGASTSFWFRRGMLVFTAWPARCWKRQRHCRHQTLRSYLA